METEGNELVTVARRTIGNAGVQESNSTHQNPSPVPAVSYMRERGQTERAATGASAAGDARAGAQIKVSTPKIRTHALQPCRVQRREREEEDGPRDLMDDRRRR